MRAARTTLIGVLVLAGCSTAPARVGPPPPQVDDPVAERTYHEIFDRWSQQTEVYQQLDTRFFLAATEESAEFREARVRRMGIFQSQPEAQVEATVAQERADAQKEYLFFVGIHTNQPRWNDLDSAFTIWRLALHTSVGEVTPTRIDRVGRPDPNTRGIYLYLADFWTGYQVHFPAVLPDGHPLVSPADQVVTLLLSSAVGKAELSFRAVPLGSPAAK